MNGDLVGMKDAEGLETTFGYLPSTRYPHYLQDIIDARGVRAARNEYDDDGRLVATIDALGHRQEYHHDIAGQVERIKDRNGNESIYIYDDNGWVLSETNAEGEETEHTYDANGNELSRTDGLDRLTLFRVDGRGNVLEEEDPLHGITQRVYGNFNQLKSEIDAENRLVTTNTYAINPQSGDETSYLVRIEDAMGRQTLTPVDLCTSGCSNTGNLKRITDPLNHSTHFGYDHNGNVRSEIDALGNETVRSFDAMGRMLTETRTRVVDGVTQTLRSVFTYDAKGQLKETLHPDNTTTKTTYNAIGKVETQTDAANRVTRYRYDDAGRQDRVTYHDGRFEETGYDGEGNVLSQTDRAGRVTRMRYDKANRLLETIYPDTTPADDGDNPRTVNEYDDAGQLTATINERLQRTEYRYDDAGRQTKVIDALLRETTHVYDLSGRRMSSTDALGRTVKFKYDLSGRLLETIYPDPCPPLPPGEVGASATGEGQVCDNADDADESNNPRSFVEYDPAGRKTAEIDEEGRKTTFGYDDVGRLTEVKLAAHTATPFTTAYAYDEQGNKTRQTDAENRTTTWTYDKQGRSLSRKLPMGQIESFGYNAAGEREQHTTINGAVMGYEYDELGRIETITFPGAPPNTRVFTYNDAGQIEAINDKGTTYGFQYDERDRLTQATDGQGRRIDYAYDKAGNRTELATPGTTITYGYDELNRLKDVVANLAGQPANLRAEYQYDPVGNREGMTQPNGSTVSYQYDRRNRLRNLTHRTAAGVLMLGLAYTVDASGLRTQIDETGASAANNRTTVYQYDALKRLTHSTVTGATAAQNLAEIFTYDKVGNRLTGSCTGQIRTCSSGRSTSTLVGPVNLTATYDANDRLTREVFTGNAGGTFDYAYDSAGNLLTKKQGTTTLALYGWDIENRLTDATLTPTGAAGNRTTTKYQYDPNGIRRSSEVIAQTVGAGASMTKTRTDFLVDPNQAYAQVLEDWTATASQAGTTEPTLPEASLQNSYVYGDDLIAEARYAPLPPGEVGANAPGEGGNDPLARIGTSTGNSSFHYDGLGTTRLLSAINVDAVGAPLAGNETITDQYAYTAFGESDLASTTGTTSNNYRYTGEQLDPNLGFYYLRARYMNPQQGRFLGMDSWMGSSSDSMSLHKYLYANANPVMGIDPTGHMTAPELMTAVNNIAINISVRVTLFTWKHPVLSALGSAVAGAVLLPTELQVPTPMSFAPGALGATRESISASGKHLAMTMRHFRDKLGVLAGGEFESFVATLLRLEKNTKSYTVDLSWKLGAKFIPDFIRRGGFLEVKAVRTLSRHDLDQAEKLAAYASQNGKPLEYIFLRRPSANDLRKLEEAIGEGTQGAEINFSYNYLFE